MVVRVTDVDNRGNAEHPYGYVYFSDSNRVLFGGVDDGYGPYGIKVTNWGDVPETPYFEIAETAIREHLSPKAKTEIDDDKCSVCLEPLDEHCDYCGECDCTGDDE